MRERLLHALDLSMLGDWDGAKRSLEDLDDPVVPRLIALLTEQQRRERERAELQAAARHELGNALSIAQANVEALVDGVLEPTPERLAAIRDAMIACGVLLEDVKKHYRSQRHEGEQLMAFDLAAVIASQVRLIAPIASSKNVDVHFDANACDCMQFEGDPERIALIVRDAVLGAVRFTPPGGAIDIACVRSEREIVLSVSTGCEGKGETLGFSLVSKLLDAMGGQARILTANTRGTTLALHLPALPVSA
jgi:signal transduction histidine kinase